MTRGLGRAAILLRALPAEKGGWRSKTPPRSKCAMRGPWTGVTYRKEKIGADSGEGLDKRLECARSLRADWSGRVALWRRYGDFEELEDLWTA